MISQIIRYAIFCSLFFIVTSCSHVGVQDTRNQEEVARKAMLDGNYNLSMAIYKKLYEANKEYGREYARSLKFAGDTGRSLEIYETMLNKDPESHEAIYQMAAIFFQANEIKKASDIILDKKNAFFDMHILRALFYHYVKSDKRSNISFRLAANEAGYDAYRFIKLSYAIALVGDLNSAIKLMTKVCEKNSIKQYNSDLYKALASLYAMNRQLDLAKKIWGEGNIAYDFDGNIKYLAINSKYRRNYLCNKVGACPPNDKKRRPISVNIQSFIKQLQINKPQKRNLTSEIQDAYNQ